MTYSAAAHPTTQEGATLFSKVVVLIVPATGAVAGDVVHHALTHVRRHACGAAGTPQDAALLAATFDAHKIRQADLLDLDWQGRFGPTTEAKLLANRRASGFVMQFVRDMQSAWSDGLDRRRRYAMADLTSEFGGWLVGYNQRSEVSGYPNYGLSPLAALQRWREAQNQKPVL